LDAGLLEQLPNKFAAFGPVVVQALVGPLPRDKYTAPGDAKVIELVGFALATSRGHGGSGALRLDAIQQPHCTLRRAWGDLEFGV
jgi:hypothetical protein